MRMKLIGGGLLLALCAAVAAPAMGEEVTVTLDNGGGTQTVHVENVLGTAELTALDFDRSRSMPFRLRVVDTGTDRKTFTVDASMTNLYRSTGTNTWDFTTPLDSAKVGLSSATAGLSARDVLAAVSGTVDGVLTVNALLCTTLGLGDCTLDLTDVNMIPQDVPLDTSLLNQLPLVPQAVEPGQFTEPDWAGIALGDPNAPTTFTYTDLRVIGGGLPTGADETAMLGDVQAALESTIDAAGAATDVVSAEDLANEVRALFPALLDSQIALILGDSTVAWTANAIGLDDILAVAGTYLSYPVLSIDTTGAAAGTYQGTLVVTGIQP